MFTGREFSNTSEQAYWAWSYKHLQMLDRELPVCRESFNAGFYLGAQYAMRVSSELSPHLARFLEFVMWLTEREQPSVSLSEGYQQELPLEASLTRAELPIFGKT